MSTIRRVWFQPGEGIAREVITADIQRYLGNDALCKPGIGTGEYEGVEGYYITAYRALTSEMVQDLILDSQRWRQEVQQGRVSYQDSRTHQSRQYYGPSAPAPADAAYAQQPAYHPPPHTTYSQDTSYTYAPPEYGQQGNPYVPAPGYGAGQPRTAVYPYPSAQQDAHSPYPRDPRAPPAAYGYPPASSGPPSQQHDMYAAPPQPSNTMGTPSPYYPAHTPTYPPPQANDARRRR